MSSWVVEHGVVPLLVPEVFPTVDFPCRHTCSLETLGTIPTSLLVFVENIFTSLVSLLFMECKLHFGNLSHEALEVMQN